jgi:O-antigen ligase
VDPAASLAFWLKSCAYACAFFLTLALARTRERAQLIAYTLVLSGLAQAVYGGLMHLSGSDLEIFGTKVNHSGQASGGFVNRNHLAGFLEITLAMGIGLMVGSLRETGQRTWRQFWRDMAALALSARAPLRLVLVAMVIALVMTRSRMGNTAFFASLLVAGTVALALSRRATRSTVILIASLIAIDIFIVGSWFGVEKTMQRIEQTTVRDVGERGDPGAQALALARDYPVFGAGGGTFYSAFTRYRGPELRAYFDHAHNDYIQFLAETGIVGLALAASLPAFALVLAVLALARRRDPLARGFAFAVLMGVCSLAIHSTVDFNLQIPANAFAFMVLLAYGWIALYLADRR